MPQYDHITFPLAGLAYLLLCLDFAARFAGRHSRPLTILLALVVLAHVLLVWGDRFEWSFQRMLEKSLPGFLIFHSALVLILAAPLLPRRWNTRCIFVAFPIVCSGALPAPFRYEEIEWMRIPILTMFVVTAVFVALGWRTRCQRTRR